MGGLPFNDLQRQRLKRVGLNAGAGVEGFVALLESKVPDARAYQELRFHCGCGCGDTLQFDKRILASLIDGTELSQWRLGKCSEREKAEEERGARCR